MNIKKQETIDTIGGACTSIIAIICMLATDDIDMLRSGKVYLWIEMIRKMWGYVSRADYSTAKDTMDVVADYISSYVTGAYDPDDIPDAARDMYKIAQHMQSLADELVDRYW